MYQGKIQRNKGSEGSLGGILAVGKVENVLNERRVIWNNNNNNKAQEKLIFTTYDAMAMRQLAFADQANKKLCETKIRQVQKNNRNNCEKFYCLTQFSDLMN